MACVNNNCSACSNCNTALARVSCSSCGHSHCGCRHCTACGCNGCACGCEHCGKERSGCSSCGARGRIGVLRCVAGPFFNCGNWWTNNANFPFYTGPCGPCASTCCCDPCCDPCCNPCCGECCGDPCGDPCDVSAAGFFAAAPVELAAGDSVALRCSSDLSDEFTASPEGIRIHRAGTYMVIYTVHVPANEVVNSRFALALNGDRVAGSALDVATVNDCTASGCTMHALVQAGCGDLLKLVALNDVSIASSPASNVFTLTITRVGD